MEIKRQIINDLKACFTGFKGVLSENYVLLSLIRQFGDQQFYWTSGNTAEVEFIVQYENRIIPVEVKSGNSIAAKSLSEYRKNTVRN